MNLAILIGRLTRDPELRYIPSTGKPVATFNIAVDRTFTGKDGQKQTDFFNIVVWGKIAENCANYLAKGRLVGIKGQIQNRTYDDMDGAKRYITEVIADQVQFLEKAQPKNQYVEDIGQEAAAVFSPKSEDPYKQLNYDEPGF